MISTDRSQHDGAGHGAERENWRQRLERACRERAQLEMVQSMLAMAGASMQADDDHEALAHARTLLTRARRAVEPVGPGADSLNLMCDLMERLQRLGGLWRALGHPVQTREVEEQVRELAFEIARRVERLDDLGLRVAIILRSAEVLEGLGDRGDAHAMRTRAFYRLSPGEISRSFSSSLLAV